MLIVKLWGGIGNQLFQYVFGQYLHYKYNQEVKYDINSFISVDKLRNREIDVISGNVEYDNCCLFSKYRGVKNRIFRYLYQLKPKNHFISEQSTIPPSFNEGHLYFFQGYWQNIKYYEWLKNNVAEYEIKSISFPKVLDEFKIDILNHKETVSMHVRRGDYFNSKNIGTFGVCNTNYYEDALDYVKNHSTCDKLYVFTDDPDWVNENLHFGMDYALIPNYDIIPFAYIELMSLCRHHIISNSSFSWWGAVLNEQQGSIVVCPDKWLLDYDLNPELDKWVKIKVVKE